MVDFIVFNELSLPFKNNINIDEKFRSFLFLVENIRNKGFKSIRTTENFKNYQILDKVYLQQFWGQVKDEVLKKKILSFMNNGFVILESPLIKKEESEEDNQALENEYFYKGATTIGGLACCDIWNSMSVSFNSHEEWCSENIFLEKQNILDDKKIEIKIRHASQIEHLNYHTNFFDMLEIEPIEYCYLKFRNTNLNFSKLDDEYGFEILNPSQQKEFLSTFHKFTQMSWDDILKSSANKKGLNYKSYDGDWFKNTEYSQKNIFKFRTSQKYRCFGYRDKDEFFVLRFEIDHEISDNG